MKNINMKNIKKIILTSILTFSLGALALGFHGAFTDSTLLADTSGQPNEWDVGSNGALTDGIYLADTSGQPNEWDVG